MMKDVWNPSIDIKSNDLLSQSLKGKNDSIETKLYYDRRENFHRLH